MELTRHQTRRYSELKPRDVEGNLFMYHLKGLVGDDLVEKHEKTYRLTDTGLQYVARISLKTGKIRLQPKLLTAVIAKDEKENHLLIRWQRQPNIGQVSIPYGMVHFGESVVDMAALELAEKAGLEGDLTYKGDRYIRGIRNGQSDRHMLVHLFEATNIRSSQHDKRRRELCECFWAKLTEIPKEQWVPGFYEIMQSLEGASHELQEITVEINTSKN